MIAPTSSDRVIDPACGSGGFLLQTIAYVQRVYPDIDKSAHIRANICGIEINPDVALSAMLRLANESLINPPFGNKGKVKDP